MFSLAKLFVSNLNASARVILPLSTRPTTLSKNNSVSINCLSLAFLPSIKKIKLDFYLKLSTAIGKCHSRWMILDDPWQIHSVNSGWTLSSQQCLNLNLQTHKKSLQDASVAIFFSKRLQQIYIGFALLLELKSWVILFKTTSRGCSQQAKDHVKIRNPLDMCNVIENFHREINRGQTFWLRW